MGTNSNVLTKIPRISDNQSTMGTTTYENNAPDNALNSPTNGEQPRKLESILKETEIFRLATLLGRVNNYFLKVHLKNLILFIFVLVHSCKLEKNVSNSECKCRHSRWVHPQAHICWLLRNLSSLYLICTSLLY